MQLTLPAAAGAILGPAGGYVYHGQTGVTFHISPIPGATGFAWSVPPGLTITDGENTESITVSIGNAFKNGYLTVSGYNKCGNGISSPEFQVTDTTSLGIPFRDDGTDGNETRMTLESFPNPFSGKTTLTYFIPFKGEVLLVIMNMAGEKIVTLVDHVEQAGSHSLKISSIFLRPGIYLARIVLRGNNNIISKCIKIICNQ